MRVTIIRDDNTVAVDGESYTVDCTPLPADFHALQWDGTSGEVEYRMTVCSHCNTRGKKPNLFVNDMTPYLPYVDAWTAAKTAATEAKRIAQEEAAKAAAASHEKLVADIAERVRANAAG